jgi:DNA-binding protein YbaB
MVGMSTVERVTAELTELRFVATVGDGAVVVRVDGFGRVVSLRAEPELVARTRMDRLGRLLVAAVTAARTAAGGTARDRFRRLGPDGTTAEELDRWGPAADRPSTVDTPWSMVDGAGRPPAGRTAVLARADEVYGMVRRLPGRVREARLRGAAGNGSVVAHADGAGTLLRLDIREAFARYCGPDRLGEYVRVAVDRAELAAEEFRVSLLDELPGWVRPAERGGR